MSPQIHGVLFDLDGTLVDTQRLILESFRYATRAVLGRVVPDEELMAKVGQPLTVQMWDWADGSQEVHDALFDTYLAHNELIHDELIAGFPGTLQVLDVLRGAGVPLGVVTSKRHGNALRALKSTGLDDYFPLLIGADDYPEHKPDPGPVVYGCALLGIPVQHVLYVGDSPYDVRAGNAAGCFTAAATWGMFDAELLLAEDPRFVCRSLAEVLPLVAGAAPLASIR